MNKKIIPLLLLGATLGPGCSTMAIMHESLEFPRDTAVIVDERKYIINTTKCAEIRDISEKGWLDCYTLDGVQSAPAFPEPSFVINAVESRFEWASTAHQAMLFDYYYGGGMEQAIEEMQSSLGLLSATLDLIDTIETSQQMDQDAIRLRTEGLHASLAGGTPALRAHQSRMVTWHLNNSRYFTQKLSE